MDMLDEKYIDGNITQEGYLYAQALLDRFVEINYETALNAVRSVSDIDTAYCRGQIMDIIRNNPPLATVPKYLQDGRPNYLWYSDFYDDITKDVFRQYSRFVALDTPITPANYATELAPIDLPYFKELVNLVSLEKLCAEAEKHISAAKRVLAPINDAEPTTEIISVEEPKKERQLEPLQSTSEPESQTKSDSEQPIAKRSYEPKLSSEQYTLLAECVETIRLFRRPVMPAQLKKLLNGRLAEPLRVMNQLPLVYLFDKMREHGYIKKAWMTTAVENGDFVSFRTPGQERRYGCEPHYLTMDQLKSRRSDSKISYIHGEESMDDMIEKMQECGNQ